MGGSISLRFPSTVTTGDRKESSLGDRDGRSRRILTRDCAVQGRGGDVTDQVWWWDRVSL